MKEGKRAVGDRRVEEGTVRRKETNETTPPHDRKKNNDTLTFDKYNLNKVSILTISDQKLKCMSWFLASTKTLNLQTYYTEKGFSVAEAKATGLLCWWLSNAGIISSYPTLIAKKIVSTHCNSTSYLALFVKTCYWAPLERITNLTVADLKSNSFTINFAFTGKSYFLYCFVFYSKLVSACLCAFLDGSSWPNIPINHRAGVTSFKA